MSQSLVVLPTYNEKDNIKSFILELLSTNPDINILVVDDSSPDGTADIVKALESDPRVNLLLREKKEGLGRAYVAGMKWALDNNFDYIIQMDADYSHRFLDLIRMRESVGHCDFVVGARWIPGGGIENWSWHRRLLSIMANIYVQVLLGHRLHDWTGGFNIWRRNVLEAIQLESLEAHGYCFQVELKYQALQLKFRPLEVPIVFEERRFGVSKMSFPIIIEALFKVWFMRFLK